jgi:hypothetical protein
MARLDPDKVRLIRAQDAAGVRLADIADGLGVGHTTVRAVLEGRTWKHVKLSGKVTRPPLAAIFKEDG